MLAIRDANLRQIQQEARYDWRVASGSARQGLLAHAVLRFKPIFGFRFRVLRFDIQRMEEGGSRAGF
jgi:hypothetical protein